MSGLALGFLAIWIVLGAGIVLVAIYGGPGAARERVLHSQSRRGRRLTGLVIAAVFIGMGIVVPGMVVAANEADNEAGAARVRLTPAQEHGRQLFGQRCQQCHTLAAANAVGTVGPNLDELKPSRDVVLDAIDKGRARGVGRMPADLVQGQDAEDVASFVAAVAGRQ
jgi:mono/diheme cytochrome c family protein